jgi:hypothetical protein
LECDQLAFVLRRETPASFGALRQHAGVGARRVDQHSVEFAAPAVGAHEFDALAQLANASACRQCAQAFVADVAGDDVRARLGVTAVLPPARRASRNRLAGARRRRLPPRAEPFHLAW